MLSRLNVGLRAALSGMLLAGGFAWRATADSIYWGDLSAQAIYKADQDGNNVAPLIDLVGNGPEPPGSGSEHVRGVAVDPINGKLYFVQLGNENYGIYWANLDGSQVERIVDGDLFLGSPFGIDVDPTNGLIVFGNDAGPAIYSANLDGSGLAPVIAPQDFTFSGPWGIELDPDNQYIYFSGQTHINRVNYDGTGAITITQSLDNPSRDMALDPSAGKLYVADANTVKRLNLDGTGIETIVTLTDFGNPTGLSIDQLNSKLYWTQPSSNLSAARIQRSNLDGSNVETLVTFGDGGFTSIAIIPTFEIIPGDTDGDGDIDDSDLGTIFSNYTGPVGASGGKRLIEGDTDEDGDIDDIDLATAFVFYTGPLAPTSVPEPASLSLIGFAGLLSVRRGRLSAV